MWYVAKGYTRWGSVKKRSNKSRQTGCVVRDGQCSVSRSLKIDLRTHFENEWSTARDDEYRLKNQYYFYTRNASCKYVFPVFQLPWTKFLYYIYRWMISYYFYLYRGERCELYYKHIKLVCYREQRHCCIKGSASATRVVNIT